MFTGADNYHLLFVHLYMTDRNARSYQLEDGVLNIPPQMNYDEVIQHLKTYRMSIKQIYLRDRNKGMKKILKEIERCPNIEYIELAGCDLGVDPKKRNMKEVFQGVFRNCLKLKQILYQQTDRRQFSQTEIKTMIKRRGSTIVEVGEFFEAAKK